MTPHVSPTLKPGPASLLEVVKVPGRASEPPAAPEPEVPGLDLEGLRWRQEVSRKGSPYRNMRPGQIIPGRRTPGLEGEPKAFRSRAEWRWSFWRKLPGSKTRAHLRAWKSLPTRKKRKG